MKKVLRYSMPILWAAIATGHAAALAVSCWGGKPDVFQAALMGVAAAGVWCWWPDNN